MKSMMRVVVLLLLGALAACGGSQVVEDDAMRKNSPAAQNPQEQALVYPETRKEEIQDEIFGQTVSDPYRWLEDAKTEEVQAWMKDQDGLTREYLQNIESREALVKRLKELSYVDSLSSPSKRGEFYFYRRRHADREKAVFYWKKGENGEEQVLLDPNTMGNGEKNISIGGIYPSKDGTKIAYKLKENNADESTMYVRETESGKVSEIDVIPGAKYARAEWTPDGAGFYYTWLPTDSSIPTAERPGYAEVRYHALGTDPSSDKTVHEKLGDPRKFLGVDLSHDGRWLFVYEWEGWASSTIKVMDLTSKKKEFKPFYGKKNVQTSITAWKDQFYIQSNEDAPRYQVLKASPKKMARDQWEVLIPQRDGIVIENMQIVGEKIVLTLLKDATNILEVWSLEGEKIREIPFPAIGSTWGMNGNPDEDTAYFTFSSFTTPRQVYKTSIQSGDTELWDKLDIPIDASAFEVDQVWYTSKDGTKVPMFLVHKKGIKKDGSTPFVLYGYGGFNVNMSPYFSSSIYPWLEAGGGYAVANLRGGGEFGEQWHQDGMLLKKQNVFDDFIGAAEFLVEEGYTSSEKLAIRGGSNGGLLVGAAMTQRPDLFGAVICAVPLLDMVRYHLFGSGKTWIAEYGSAEDKEQFEVLYGYSPYHNVDANKEYPPMLMLSASHDDRVDPLHARKMVAALQHTKSKTPQLLRVEANAGHGGADQVIKSVNQSADVYAFLMDLFKMSPKKP